MTNCLFPANLVIQVKIYRRKLLRYTLCGLWGFWVYQNQTEIRMNNEIFTINNYFSVCLIDFHTSILMFI